MDKSCPKVKISENLKVRKGFNLFISSFPTWFYKKNHNISQTKNLKTFSKLKKEKPYVNDQWDHTLFCEKILSL